MLKGSTPTVNAERPGGHQNVPWSEDQGVTGEKGAKRKGESRRSKRVLALNKVKKDRNGKGESSWLAGYCLHYERRQLQCKNAAQK